MKAPGFAEGVVVALVASIGAAGAWLLLAPIAGAGTFSLVIAGIGLGYLLYLAARARARVGRASAVLAWLLAVGALGALDAPPAAHAAAQLTLAWIARSAWFHHGVLASLADMGIAASGLAAAAWALHQSHSVALAVWCLMLAQAAFVFIPARATRSHGHECDPAHRGDAFARAQHAAESAVRRLAAGRYGP